MGTEDAGVDGDVVGVGCGVMYVDVVAVMVEVVGGVVDVDCVGVVTVVVDVVVVDVGGFKAVWISEIKTQV